MAATAAPPRITPERAGPIPRARLAPATVTLRLRLADLEDRDLTAEQLGRAVQAIGLAQAYGSISPALLAMRTGTTREAAHRLLDHLIRSGSLPAEKVTGSTL